MKGSDYFLIGLAIWGINEIDKNKEQIKKSLGNQIEIKDAMVIKE